MPYLATRSNIVGRFGHGIIGSNLKEARCNSADKTAYKGSKINTDFIEYVPKTLMKKEVKKDMLILLLPVFSL